MTPAEEDLLLAAVASAHRPPSRDGHLRYHPAWHDLSPEARVAAHAIALGLRAVEAALDPDGLSSTARRVLTKVRGA